MYHSGLGTVAVAGPVDEVLTYPASATTMKAVPVDEVLTYPAGGPTTGPAGAIPSQIGGIGTGTLLLAAGALALLFMLGSKH